MKPWLKLWNEFATDQVVQTMSEALQRRLIMIFCFMQSGDLDKLDEQELAKAMAISFDELADTKHVFLKKGFITKNWHPLNWKKRQEFDEGAAQRMRNMRRNKSVTKSEHESNNGRTVTAHSRASDSRLLNSQEGDARGSDADEVENLAAATDARWPDQNAGVTVRDLCQTFDFRLVGDILNQAFDKDPDELPKTWIRRGCQNQVNRGWTPKDAKAPARPKTAAEIDAEVDALEAKYNAQREAERVKRERSAQKP